MSFLMEQAGGQAFTGKQRVLTSLFLLLSCFATQIYENLISIQCASTTTTTVIII
jgi:hypothetical protein